VTLCRVSRWILKAISTSLAVSVWPSWTWNSPDYEPVVEYPFESRDGVLRVWNIYKINRGKEVVEKWTGNADFWVDMVSPSERVYHCSSGAEDPPHVESLIFKITIVEGSC
jgi:hypothetical protein